MDETFEKIWFTHGTSGSYVFRMYPWEDTGKLRVTDGGLEFYGGKTKLIIPAHDLEKISQGLQGTDPISNWVRVRFRKDENYATVFFKDGRWGVLSRSDRIEAAIKSLVPAFQPAEKKCPHCAEYIKSEAKVCKHCGRNQP